MVPPLVKSSTSRFTHPKSANRNAPKPAFAALLAIASAFNPLMCPRSYERVEIVTIAVETV